MMESLRELWRRLRNAGRRDTLNRRLDDEIRFHIEHLVERNVRSGMSPERARRQAMVEFGGVQSVREAAGDEYRPALLDDFARDLRHGGRALRRAPGFALASMLTLGLGIGAATAVFSVVDGVLLRPLPYPQSDRIVRIYELDADGDRINVADPNFVDWRARTRTLSAMAEVASSGQVSVLSPTGPTRTTVVRVSAGFFDVMRTRPALGRPFAPEEQRPGAAPAAVISEPFWRASLGGGRDVVGRTLTFDDRVYQIVGIMPAGFDYPAGTSVWVPRELDGPETSRTAHNYRAVARVRDGTSLAAAQAEISAISRDLGARFGDDIDMVDAALVPLRDQLTAGVRPALMVLMAAAAFLLLIACANVSNLSLARAATRTRELAVRLAIGAGRGRLVRQLLAESLVLSCAGGVLAVLIAFWSVKSLVALEPGNLSRVSELAVHWTALGFALAVSIVTGLVLGLVTVARVRPAALRGALTDGQRTMAGGRGGQRLRDGLVVVQVGLTLVLLVAAGLLGKSFLRLIAVDVGYRIDDALVLDLSLPGPRTPADGRRQGLFQQELMGRLRALPGVRAVGGINAFPLGGGFFSDGRFLEMTRADEIQRYEDFATLTDVEARSGHAGYRIASDDYFQAMGIPLLRGRFFGPGDDFDAPHVALISQSLAEARWPGQDPIGRFIQFGNMDRDLRGFRIVGVVGDIRELSPEALPGPLFYGNNRQRPVKASTFSIVLTGTGLASAAAAERTVHDLNPELPVAVRTVESAFDESLAGRRFSLFLIGAFGTVALVLAGMGIYGVVSYLVAQRTREIGIRMALGARTPDLLRLIVGKGVGLALVGVGLGVVAAAGLTRLLIALLYDVSPTDPLVFAGVASFILAAVLVASYVPALRATRIAPVNTLRAD